LPDLLKLGGDCLAFFNFALNGFGRLIDAIGNGFDLVLDLPYQILNLLGTFLRGFSQGTDFIRNHRKPLAVPTGPGRLDGSIQGQQVGLIGNPDDCLDDIADVGCLFFQFAHHLHRGGLTFGGYRDIIDQPDDVLTGALDQGLNRLTANLTGSRVAELSANGYRDLGKGSQ
jgi:hypothetical protein